MALENLWTFVTCLRSSLLQAWAGRLRAAGDHHGGGRAGYLAVLWGGRVWSWRCSFASAPTPNPARVYGAHVNPDLSNTRSAHRNLRGASAIFLIFLLLLLEFGWCTGSDSSFLCVSVPEFRLQPAKQFTVSTRLRAGPGWWYELAVLF